MVGRPEMLRIGEAATEHQAQAEVHEVIDRALKVQKTLRFLKPKRKNDE